MTIERRHSAAAIELRHDAETAPRTLVGYAAVFYRAADPTTQYSLYTDYVERIAPGAFARAIAEDDVRALFNHDANQILGRNISGTLRLIEDEVGLRYEIDLPDTTTAAEVAELVNRGDLSGSSFAFQAIQAEHTEANDLLIRTITEAKLYDVGPVTYPAYEATTVAARSADAVRAELAPPAPAIPRDLIAATARLAEIA